MDPSLAKGHKNEFFRQLNSGINKIIQEFQQTAEKSIPKFNKRNQWERFIDKSVRQLGKYLLHHIILGSKRHPILLLYLFEGQSERSYNSWNEKCISSCTLFLSASPFNCFVRPIGFNLSEHAIQRIFERLIPKNITMSYNEKLQMVTNELQYAPIVCAFWHLVAVLQLQRRETDPIEVTIPTPNGILIGQINPQKMNKCELRTFVMNDQLFAKQQKNRTDLLFLSTVLSGSEMAFFLLSIPKDIEIDQNLVHNMLINGKPILEANGFKHLIPT